ncbi:MAG: non-homologous end-joining DNA ligase [Hyphomonadaceae bacterium]|nr:non-homologous end-joining DNA ligase [Hyphomonadaceae bacterium]
MVSDVPVGDRWLHEIKYDGYRCLLSIGGGRARAFTRSSLDWSDRFARVVEAGAALPVDDALFDGEIVILGPDGRSNFQALQRALKYGGKHLVFYAFDLLRLNGEDLRRLPQLERKQRLERILPKKAPVIRYSDHIRGGGVTVFKRFCAEGLEGVVSKDVDATYIGRRTTAWLKTKCLQRQEFIIVGWTSSEKARSFRSIILATRVGGALRFAGKVGTGFDQAELVRLAKAMAPLARKAPPVNAPRAAVRGANWIEPKLVAEITYTEMTSDGVLRHPSYLGLREDKPADEVVFEAPRSARRSRKKT